MTPRITTFGLLFAMSMSVPAAQTTVEQWGVFEVAARGPTNGHQFLDGPFSARFAQGVDSFEIPGFYDDAGVYRVRFMPEKLGVWRYATSSSAPELHDRTGEFTVTKPSPGNHGPVRVAHTFHFAYADGTPYKQLGTTCYVWTHQEKDGRSIELPGRSYLAIRIKRVK